MTTMAALFAGIPLVLATGPGTELRRPLGITIIGGLFVSQILTLYTTPVIYLLIDRLRRRSRPAAVVAPAKEKGRGTLALLKRPPAARIAGGCPNHPSLTPAALRRRPYRFVRIARSRCRCASATASR